MGAEVRVPSKHIGVKSSIVTFVLNECWERGAGRESSTLEDDRLRARLTMGSEISGSSAARMISGFILHKLSSLVEYDAGWCCWSWRSCGGKLSGLASVIRR